MSITVLQANSPPEQTKYVCLKRKRDDGKINIKGKKYKLCVHIMFAPVFKNEKFPINILVLYSYLLLVNEAKKKLKMNLSILLTFLTAILFSLDVTLSQLSGISI